MNPRLPNPVRMAVGIAVFGALAAAGGYLLMAIPNVEVFSLMLFISGYTLGIKDGILATLVAVILYFGLNPQGGLFPPLLIAQTLGSLPFPITGWLTRRWLTRLSEHNKTSTAIKGRLGLTALASVLTFWYDLLTNLSYPLVAGFDWRGILTTLGLGVPFAVVHIISNSLIFSLLAPPLIRLVRTQWR